MRTAAPIPCRWCGRACQLRRGGSPRVFCGQACRTAFHTAARCWAERAVAAGMLTLDQIRNGDPVACTLLTGAVSTAPIAAVREPVLTAPAERPGEADDLLKNFLLALIDLPGDGWVNLMAALPDEMFERLDRWMEAFLA